MPEPRAPEPDVELEVAGLGLLLRGFPLAEQPFLVDHYPGFYRVGESGRARLRVDCVLEEKGLLIDLPAPGEPPVVEVEEPGPGRLRTRSHWHEAELDLAAGEGVVRFRSSVDHAFRVSLENFLRVAFANLLLADEACLVHAAALVTPGGRADVFFGLSGSGKSRLVELSADRPALSDDMVALRLLPDGTLAAEAVPFHGEFPSSRREPGRFPVRHLLRALRGAAHEIRSIPPALQAARLRACLPFLRAGDERALDLAARMVAAHPARELDFADDPGFRRLLD